MVKDLDADNIKVLSQNGKERHLAFFATNLEFCDLKNKASVDFPCSENASTNAIPGLYVFDDFLSPGKIQFGFLKLIFRGGNSCYSGIRRWKMDKAPE